MTGIPVFVCCSTKNAKFFTINPHQLPPTLHRLARPLPTIPAFIQTNNERLHFARCKHTVQDPPDSPLLITDFPTIHGRLLANVRAFVLCSLFSSPTDGLALLLRFRLHEPPTAAATLRQSVMIVVDRVVEEDRRMLLANELGPITLPNGATKELSPTTHDIFAVFGDLRLLGSGEHLYSYSYNTSTPTRPLLSRVKLIKSVPTNYLEPFRKVCLSSPSPIRDLYASSCPQIILMFTASEPLLLLQHHLLSLLLKRLSDRSAFPLALRGTRVVFLLLKQFSFELRTEAEIIFTPLIHQTHS
jgi:Guanine nucleotide exchange factor in Golgi transport N-terminal